MRKIFRVFVIFFLFIGLSGIVGNLFFPKEMASTKRSLRTEAKKVFSKMKTNSHHSNDDGPVIIEPNEKVIWGIDISHHQRGIQWKELETEKPHFVFLKATEGATHKDTKYSEYKSKFKELSIPVGAYHFFSYTSSGKSQAIHFLKVAQIQKGDLLPVLDVEYKNRMPDDKTVKKNINEFINHIVKETGSVPLIYCESDYYLQYLKGNLKNDHLYWISDFWRTPKTDYILWQKTDRFVHPAFKGTIDYNEFKGTGAEFDVLFVK